LAVRDVPPLPRQGLERDREHYDLELNRVLSLVTGDADTAQTTADTADGSADAAQTSADAAQSTADTADTTANTVTSDLTIHAALAATESVQAHVKKATAVADVASVDATDLPTALTLVNELKAQVNAMLASDRTAGQRTT